MTSRLSGVSERQKVAVVCPYDSSTANALACAINAGFAKAILVGCPNKMPSELLALEKKGMCSLVVAESIEESARVSVTLAAKGEADILMKGLANTDILLKAILNKQEGLLKRGSVLTHMAAAQVPGFGRLLFFTDAAVIPYPTHEQRLAQVGYASSVCHAFGISTPRIALVHFSEKASPKFPHTMGYAEIINTAKSGIWGNVVVDGPLDVRAACDSESCRVKGIKTPLGGEADALVFPDLEAANAFYKTLSYFSKAEMAAVLCGAKCPVVLPSRSDDDTSKFNSLCIAAISNIQDGRK